MLGSVRGLLLGAGLLVTACGGDDPFSPTIETWRAGDTFLTDVPFTAEPNRLTAEETINGVLVSAVLTK